MPPMRLPRQTRLWLRTMRRTATRTRRRAARQSCQMRRRVLYCAHCMLIRQVIAPCWDRCREHGV